MMVGRFHLRFLFVVCLLACAPVFAEDKVIPFDVLEAQYAQQIQPLLTKFCNECHSTENREGELDLQRFKEFVAIRQDPKVFQKVRTMLGNGEMPPEESPQLSVKHKTELITWVNNYLNAEAMANAGDPGPVVLRRLNNSEYTYTIRDLTGIPLNPAEQFPVDGAAGEGFTNTGAALGMSPALVTKYFDAAKEIANHAVLLPEGIRFSPSTSRRDWTNKILNEIRAIYYRHTRQVGDASTLNKWDVPDPTILTNNDGRVDLTLYFSALVQYREQLIQDIDTVENIAQKEKLNAKYLRILATMLVSGKPSTLLLDRIRDRWQQAKLEEVPGLVNDIRTWQKRLWKYNVVGHFGSIRPWQAPASPLVDNQNIHLKLKKTNGSDVVSLFLTTGSAGDGQQADIVEWKSPRIVRTGRPPILLRDVCATSIALNNLRQNALAETSRYLAAAFVAKDASQNSDQKFDLNQLANEHHVDPVMLKAWLSYLGIHGGEVQIKEYLHQPFQDPNHDFVKGWGFPNAAALLFIGNASDKKVNVPGDMLPHSIGVHPRPERWVAVGWKSPIDGSIQINAFVQHAHPSCGNGVSWSLELRRGSQKRVLQAGDVGLGGKAAIEPIDEFAIQKGDFVSLVIDAKEGNHSCDLTQIDLTLNEVEGQKREWSLSGDCANNLNAGNPHADRLGNVAAWHFYTGLVKDANTEPVIPAESILARWLNASDAESARKIATELSLFLTNPLLANATKPNAELYQQLTSLNGSLFSQLDFATLAQGITPEELKESEFGLDPKRFGVGPAGASTSTEHLIVEAPAVIEVKFPADLVDGAEFVATAALHSKENNEGSTQVQVTTAPPADSDPFLPDASIVVNKESEAEKRYTNALEDFRSYFPTAMCYPKIVPVDEVVTIVLFHAEYDHLARLMLDEEEKTRLDRLWHELRYVSQDALTSLTVFEQLMAFASQDGDPSLYEKLREPFNQRAANFRQQLVDSEDSHLDDLLRFAARAYRRPLQGEEGRDIRSLYSDLRKQDLSHDEAFRLTLAKVLTAPAFLYRLENPQPSETPVAVSDWELANRLSYFLWSTMPDAELKQLAAKGKLRDPKTLLVQSQRMLGDAKTRRLAIEFACQWLHIRGFDQHDEKSERHFPEFNDLRKAMYEESILFFTDLFQNDGSVLEILEADHTFLNEKLAKHYGIPNVKGDHWRRVEGVKQYSRGGILTQASTLSKQSGASRTSAILRGNWIYESLLGERLPRPPLNVPVLPEIVPEGLTERELIEQHSSAPSCVKCHIRIDGYGFSLEGFDAIGRFREKDQTGNALNTQATLMDGTTISGMSGLRNYLLTTHRKTFVRQFCRKLLGYALGRSVQLSDEPLLEQMMAKLASNDYKISALFETIILSDQFRKIRGRNDQLTTTNEE